MQELYLAQQNAVNQPGRGYWDIQSSEGPFLLWHLWICIFFFCLKVFSSSHPHIQTGTDLKWFQEGPCLLLCFTLCVWPSTTNLFYLFIPFSHAGTILYCKHLFFFLTPNTKNPPCWKACSAFHGAVQVWMRAEFTHVAFKEEFLVVSLCTRQIQHYSWIFGDFPMRISCLKEELLDPYSSG